MCTTDMKHMHVNLCMKMTVDLWGGFLLLKRRSLPICKTSDLKKWIAEEPYYTVMVRYMRVYLFLNILQKI